MAAFCPRAKARFRSDLLVSHSAFQPKLTALLGISAALSIGAVIAVARWSEGVRAPERELPVAAGTNFQLVFVGKSTCSACNDPELPQAIHRIFEETRFQAELSTQPLTTLVVITDPDHQVGIRFAERFEEFDEIALGGGWNNTVLRTVHERSQNGVLATPALYVIRRTVRNRNNGTGLNFSHDTVLFSVIGAVSIKRFAQGLDSVHTLVADSILGVSLPDSLDTPALLLN